MRRLFYVFLGMGLCFYALTAAADAQATRTWVSGLGDDANPCSRTAPCKTFPGAYSRTAVGGEIDVIDPGGFGTISIGHSLTIDGGGGLMASILASSGTTGVNINAGATDNVILRNLNIQGVSNSSFPGVTGIAFNSGNSLSVEHCVIENFSQYGINNTTATRTFMNVLDTKIDNAAIAGIFSTSTTASGANQVSVYNSAVYDSGIGMDANTKSAFTVANSIVANNSGDGIVANGAIAIMNLQQVTVSRNANGLHAITGGLIRVGQSTIVSNTATGVFGDTGTISSWLDNYVAGNGTDGTFNGPALTKI